MTILLINLLPVSNAAGQIGPSPRMRMEQAKEIGQEALARRDFGLAISHLQTGLEVALSERNLEEESIFSFRLGLAFQQQAASLQPATKAPAISQAVRYYERYLELKPESGGVLNNLAQLYRETQRTEEAQELYARAIALDDSLKGFYALNLANMLTSQEKFEEAARYYRLTLAEYPDHPEARKGLTDAYIHFDTPGLISTLWRQIEKRRELDATMIALDALSRPARFNEPDDDALLAQKTDLLTCVVVGLSRGHVGPNFFDRSDNSQPASSNAAQAARILRALETDPMIGAGVQEITKVFAAPELDPSDDWWASRGNPLADPEEGWWPRDAFRMLLRSLGDWYKARDDEDTAIAYYKLSNELTATQDEETDLIALIRLSEIYAGQNNLPAIDDLLDRYSPTLFESKGLAYKNSELRKIYMFHRTLGIMYGLTERWGNSNNVQSAIFQLESALETRALINREASRTEKLQPVAIDPRIINLLAKAYTAIGDPGYAATIQLQYAGELYEAEDAASARQIMVEINEEALNRRERRRYERLKANLTTQSTSRRSGYRSRN